MPSLKLTRQRLLIALVAVAVVVLIFWPRAKPVETVTVARGPIVQSVVATGRVTTPTRIEIGAQVTGTVETVTVREGDLVKPGQLLVTLRDDEARAAQVQAQASLVEARARITQLDRVAQPMADQAVRQAEANLRVAEAEYQRAQALVAQGFYSGSKADDAARNLDTARAALLSARAQAEGNAKGGAERALANARLVQAEAALKAAQARLDNQRLTAPETLGEAARVLTRTVEPGTIAQPGKVLLTLADQGETRIYVDVDEKNLRYLAPGATALGVADAYPGERFDARVYYVAPSIDPKKGTVEVRLTVPKPPAYLRPDMTVSVEMVTGRKDDALVVASDAVRGADTQEPWVLAVQDGRAVKVPVKLGLKGVGSSEIVGGVQAGDILVVAQAAAGPGDRVSAQPRVVGPRRNFDVPGLSR